MRARFLSAVAVAWLFAFALSGEAEAQRARPRRPRAEVVAWAEDASVVVFSEASREQRRQVELVARRVPSGDVVARVGVFPGPCSRVIEGRVAVVQTCALAELRPRLPASLRGLRYHTAANERGRIQTITMRADGSVVEHQLPRLGLVIRGRSVSEQGDRLFAVLELSRIDRAGEARVLDRRPVRPDSRRRWTLLQAGDDLFILVGRGVLRRIGRPRQSEAPAEPPGAAEPPRERPQG